MNVFTNLYLQADTQEEAEAVALLRLELQGWPMVGAAVEKTTEQFEWNPRPGRWWNVSVWLPACSMATMLGVDA